MKKKPHLRKLALFGRPGAGKSTSSSLIAEIAEAEGWRCVRIRFAEPLYEAQHVIYSLAGKPLRDRTVQDGVLLSFLGMYFRKINALALTSAFDRREKEIMSAMHLEPLLLLNDDMRATEAAFLRMRGYHLVRVAAPVKLCEARRKARGDLSVGSARHQNERGLMAIQAEATLQNKGSIESLREKLVTFMRTLT